MKLKEYLTPSKFKKLKKEFKIDNDLAVPQPVKVVVNMGIGDLGLDKKKLEIIKSQFSQITGQVPAIRKTKQAVSAFDVKENQIVGLHATLRKKRMYDFIKKLTSIILPNWRSFKGVPESSITEQGNITIGLSENVIIPEIDYEKVEITNGMSVTINTTAKNKKEARILLETIGLIFESKEAKALREKVAQRRKEERQMLAEKKKAYQELAKIQADEKEDGGIEESEE